MDAKQQEEIFTWTIEHNSVERTMTFFFGKRVSLFFNPNAMEIVLLKDNNEVSRDNMRENFSYEDLENKLLQIEKSSKELDNN